SAVAPGSVGSHPGGSQETLIPPKPRGSHPDGTKRSMRPFDVPDQTTVPNVQARALEERLRRGQIERPIAQSQVSDWLEQLHSCTVGQSSAQPVTQSPDSQLRELYQTRLSVQTGLDQSKMTDHILKTLPVGSGGAAGAPMSWSIIERRAMRR